MVGFDISIINTGLIIVGGLVLVWQQKQNKATSISTEVIAAYEKQVKLLKEEVEKLTAVQIETKQQMEKIQEIVAAKDAQIKSLTDLVQNRNPELVAILVDMKTFLIKLDGKMDKFFSRLEQQTIEQTTILKTEKERHDEIDKQFSENFPKEAAEYIKRANKRKHE